MNPVDTLYLLQLLLLLCILGLLRSRVVLITESYFLILKFHSLFAWRFDNFVIILKLSFSFNDRIRDAMLGGSPFGHPLQQGFVTGLFLQVVNQLLCVEACCLNFIWFFSLTISFCCSEYFVKIRKIPVKCAWTKEIFIVQLSQTASTCIDIVCCDPLTFTNYRCI